MSKYIINEEIALVINAEVFLLVKETNPTSNEVCGKCDLYDDCWQPDENLKYCDLCITKNQDTGWFFKRHDLFTRKGGKDLIRFISKGFLHK